MKKPILIAVYAVIPYKGNFLTIRRAPKDSRAGAWELPGGKIDPRETPWTAIVREVKEETGLNIDPIEVVDISSFETDEKYQIKITFKTDLMKTNPVVKLSKEHDMFEWKSMKAGEKHE